MYNVTEVNENYISVHHRISKRANLNLSTVTLMGKLLHSTGSFQLDQTSATVLSSITESVTPLSVSL